VLVDDDRATLAWMTPALEARGHVVRAFRGASEALDALESFTPDLIIADILMPEIDGLTFARMVRRFHGVPLMFVSIANRRTEAVIVGAVGYVQKPVTAPELRAAVEQVLGRRDQPNVVLVVDDDAATRALYRVFLEPGFTVLEAEHGLAALEVLATHHVDLAIVDVHMPRMNGVELIRRMRKDPALVELPVIVQTTDRSALATPLWRDLHVSQVVAKADFLDWLSLQIEAHLGDLKRSNR
jgi:CheY-like chemotaxis protein